MSWSILEHNDFDNKTTKRIIKYINRISTLFCFERDARMGHFSCCLWWSNALMLWCDVWALSLAFICSFPNILKKTVSSLNSTLSSCNSNSKRSDVLCVWCAKKHQNCSFDDQASLALYPEHYIGRSMWKQYAICKVTRA